MLFEYYATYFMYLFILILYVVAENFNENFKKRALNILKIWVEILLFFIQNFTPCFYVRGGNWYKHLIPSKISFVICVWKLCQLPSINERN